MIELQREWVLVGQLRCQSLHSTCSFKPCSHLRLSSQCDRKHVYYGGALTGSLDVDRNDMKVRLAAAYLKAICELRPSKVWPNG
jgi:hypothetical protein